MPAVAFYCRSTKMKSVLRLKTLHKLGAEAIVIHFLHAYANPVHEQRAAEIAQTNWPTGFISISSDILREVREFERGSTAAVNAYVQPVLSSYLSRISDRLQKAGFGHDLLVMQGNGGTLTAPAAARQPVQDRDVRPGCRCCRRSTHRTTKRV
ncbi:MAG: hypothetical protein Ct9H300mP14_14350 [Gammaproteobacteria bacterium]|nr:MAG: hypothetical protein Ct9H300mP14_14350 [Gammaproteobacteria bacterium]